MHQSILYDILGVKRGATVDEINKAYRKRAFDLHPDRNHNPDALEQINLLNVARATLVDKKKRTQYDASLIRLGGVSHAWFCPECDNVQVFVSQYIWKCNVCGLWGRLIKVAAYIGEEVKEVPA